MFICQILVVFAEQRLDGVPFTHILHPGASQELQKRYMRPAPTSAA
jgi:hypothetical protein